MSRKGSRIFGAALGIGLSALAFGNPVRAVGNDLDWMQGRWCGGDNGELIEESWLAPVGGELLGLSRASRAGRVTSFEFMRIAVVDGVSTYHAQPGGRPVTAFARTAGGDSWVRFENRKHDFPQRIEYRRDGEGLLAQISGPGDAGKESVISYRYARCSQ